MGYQDHASDRRVAKPRPLGAWKRTIDRGQVWQNDLEANFGERRRMADRPVARAGT